MSGRAYGTANFNQRRLYRRILTHCHFNDVALESFSANPYLCCANPVPPVKLRSSCAHCSVFCGSNIIPSSHNFSAHHSTSSNLVWGKKRVPSRSGIHGLALIRHFRSEDSPLLCCQFHFGGSHAVRVPPMIPSATCSRVCWFATCLYPSDHPTPRPSDPPNLTTFVHHVTLW
jgi:hypothetical protein